MNQELNKKIKSRSIEVFHRVDEFTEQDINMTLNCISNTHSRYLHLTLQISVQSCATRLRQFYKIFDCRSDPYLSALQLSHSLHDDHSTANSFFILILVTFPSIVTEELRQKGYLNALQDHAKGFWVQYPAGLRLFNNPGFLERRISSALQHDMRIQKCPINIQKISFLKHTTLAF